MDPAYRDQHRGQRRPRQQTGLPVPPCSAAPSSARAGCRGGGGALRRAWKGQATLGWYIYQEKERRGTGVKSPSERVQRTQERNADRGMSWVLVVPEVMTARYQRYCVETSRLVEAKGIMRVRAEWER